MCTTAVTMDDGTPPLPPHWIFNGERDSPNYNGSLIHQVVLVAHRILCLVTFGGMSLRPIWVRSHSMEVEVWEEGRNMLRERIQHTNIVVRSFGSGVAGHSSIFFVGRFASHHDRCLLQHRSADRF